MESDILQKELSWDELRMQLKKAKLKPEYKCRRCVWSDTESGYIFCTRQKCEKEAHNESKQTS